MAEADDTALVVPEGVTVTLDLNGHTIDRALTEIQENGSVIIVNGTLTVTDSSDPATGRITGGYTILGGGVYIGSLGKFTMSGSSITGNAAADYGGGVLNEGEFTMSDGSITGNTGGRIGAAAWLTMAPSSCTAARPLPAM